MCCKVAIIRYDEKTSKWRVYDASLYDNGARFDSILDALLYARRQGYEYGDEPTYGFNVLGIDFLISKYSLDLGSGSEA